MAGEDHNPYLPKTARLPEFAEVYGRQQARTANSKLEFIEQYKRYNGNVRRAALATGIIPKTFYNWCKADPQFGEAVKIALEEEHDIAQDALMLLVRKGDPVAIRYYLSHKHPDYKPRRRTTPPHKILSTEEMYSRILRREMERGGDDDEEDEDNE